MAKNLGTFTFAANFQVKAAEALDPRMVAASKADLINKANWPSDGDTIYVYKGLIVDCGADGVYRLIDETKALASDYSGWQRIDAGGVKIDNIYTYKGSVDTYASLPVVNEVGDVYNVETEFSIEIEQEEGDPIVKHYPAGTNVAWNGEDWDTLAGSVDLSAYATKEEVSVIRTDVATNKTDISNLSKALGETNAEVAKKVDAVEGSSLISSEKLALIDTNAQDIQALENQNLDSRLATIEGMFKDGETEIDLSSINASISDHSTRIASLEADNTANKTNISNLQTQANGHGERLTAIETLNAEQSTQISDLSTRVVAVEAHGTAITNLTTTVNEHTQSISTLTSDLGTVSTKVQTIENDYLKASDKSELQGNIDGKVAQSEYNTAIEALEKADTDNLAAANKFTTEEIAKLNHAAVSAQVEANKTAIATLNGSDTGKSAREIVQDEVAKQLQSENITESFDTLQEIASWLSAHPQDVIEMQNNIQHVLNDYLNSSDKEEIQNIIIENERVTAEAYINLDSRVIALEDKNATIDSALQASDITTGSANGTIAVKGTDVAVKGLGSAAFVESTTFAAASNTYTKAEVNALLEWEEVD